MAQLLIAHSKQYGDSFLSQKEVELFFNTVFSGPLDRDGKLMEGNNDFFYRKQLIGLHERILALARKCKVKTVMISGIELRCKLLGDEKGTKQRMAECLAAMFPEELSSRLPPKRRASMNEDSRMDIFGAVALAVAKIKSQC